MELVKKNIVSIVCGVIAIAAVVAAFIPMGGFFAELDQKVNESEANYLAIKNIASSNFTKPLVDPFKAEAPPLEVFPTQPVIDAGKKAVETMATRSSDLLQKAMAMNRRTPLVPDALPIFQSGSAQADFKLRYYSKMREWIQKMNAVTPPQSNEQRAAEQDLWDREFKHRLLIAGGQELNRQPLDAEFNERKKTLPDEMKVQRSTRGTMYITERQIGDIILPTVFDDNIRGIPLPNKPDLPELGDIWCAQLAIWIQDDIIQAIADTNSKYGRRPQGSNTVPVQGAVVKRLTRITIPKRYITKLGETIIAIPKGPIPQNMQIPPDEPGQFKPFYGTSVTGRISNSLYDVVHFTVTVDIEAAQATQFINMLQANRFLTVRDVDVMGVDRELLFKRGFVYGDQPVVQMTLRCEALFFRDWTLEWMPEGIQKLLNIQPKPAGVVGAY